MRRRCGAVVRSVERGPEEQHAGGHEHQLLGRGARVQAQGGRGRGAVPSAAAVSLRSSAARGDSRASVGIPSGISWRRTRARKQRDREVRPRRPRHDPAAGPAPGRPEPDEGQGPERPGGPGDLVRLIGQQRARPARGPSRSPACRPGTRPPRAGPAGAPGPGRSPRRPAPAHRVIGARHGALIAASFATGPGTRERVAPCSGGP